MSPSQPSPHPQHIAIAGAGVIGLTCAYLLSEAGHRVTIVARNFPGDKSTEWASPWAGALLAPHPDSGFSELQLSSLKFYQHLLETYPESGVKSLRITEYYDDRPNDKSIWYKPHMQNFTLIPPASLPRGATLGFSYDGLIVNPTDFLPWLTSGLKNQNVQFINHTLPSLAALRTLTRADLLINATGLGAKMLAHDNSVYAVRGQTIFVKCDKQIGPRESESLFNQATLHQGSHYTYAIPRPSSAGFILGGVSQPAQFSSQPDVALRPQIMDRVNTLTKGAFDWVDLETQGEDIVGFRPARKGGLRVQRERDVVHAYGVGGLGYLFAFGIAEEVRRLVDGVGGPRL
ncbi:putative FAD dependent oxidoreductase [Decorospora gaudefroyi]|uniref:Putative FAD dependent oxidoreductase n=1 Tax=Decorospora gaudefroyi TaxID=184978 RepID=A0A6A5K1N4_9PLEO|nr:putative FAD dependent oxidoreductase [Decorospora gaudefroyi]